MEDHFRTMVKIEAPRWRIDYGSKLLLLGSCFSDNIGKIMLRAKLGALVNPYGVAYNPAAISNLIRRTIKKELFSPDEIIFDNGLWHSLDLHGIFSNKDRDLLLKQANETLTHCHDWLKSCSFLIVTFGTAWVFEYGSSGMIVNNCHKIAASAFRRRRLTVDEIYNDWTLCLENLYTFNPDLKVIFSISPVRHLKDGAHENQLSKSTLLLSVDRLISGTLEKCPDYFPSYEIVMDELRDYRFYSNDMIHIGDTATHYLFRKFTGAYCSPKTLNTIDTALNIQAAIEHRFLNDHPEEQQKFANTMISKLIELQKQEPLIRLQAEKEYFIKLGQITN